MQLRRLLQLCRSAALCRALAWALGLGLVVSTSTAWAAGEGAARSMPADVSDPAAPLVLTGHKAALRAWPHLRVLREKDSTPLDVRALIAQPERFEKPRSAPENLGVSDHAMWLRVAFQVSATAPVDWLFNIDFAALDEMSVYLVKDGKVLAHHHTGELVPVASRPLPLRTLGVPLRLTPGNDYELLVRVRNNGALLVPAEFVQPSTYYAKEARTQLLQGIAAGLGVFLLAYSVLQWMGSRNAMFVYFAFSSAGATGLALALHGLGAQHLWPHDPWLIGNAGIICAFITLAFGLLFADRAMDMAQRWPRLAQLCRGTSALCAVALACFVSDMLSYQQAHWLLSIMSMAPIVLAMPVALKMAWQGDVAARYMVVGWVFRGSGAMTLALLMRGAIPFSDWAIYAAQVGAVVQMLAWLGVLSVHTHRQQLAGRQAEQQRLQAEVERAQMASLALTDPLTGLANRRGLEQQGDRIVAQSSPRSMAALMMMDLDNFKPINDTYGHDVGDELLAGVAGRLRACVGDGNCVARLGGDEFVIVVSHLFHEHEAHDLAERIRSEVAKAFFIRGNVCEVGVTVGYAMAPENGADLRALLEAADAALYQGKNQGKSQVQRWVPGLVNPLARESLALA